MWDQTQLIAKAPHFGNALTLGLWAVSFSKMSSVFLPLLSSVIPGGYPLENPLGITGKGPKTKNFFAMMLNIGLVRNHKEMGKAPNLKRENWK